MLVQSRGPPVLGSMASMPTSQTSEYLMPQSQISQFSDEEDDDGYKFLEANLITI